MANVSRLWNPERDTPIHSHMEITGYKPFSPSMNS